MTSRNYAIKYHGDDSVFLYRVVDVLIICCLLYAISTSYTGSFPFIYEWLMTVILVSFVLAAELTGVYRLHHRRTIMQVIKAVLGTWFVCIATVLSIGFFLKIAENYSRVVLGSWFLLTPTTLLMWRWALILLPRFFRGKECYKCNSLIIGANCIGSLVAKELENKHVNENFIGFFDDHSSECLRHFGFPSSLCGNVEDAIKFAKEQKVKNVYIAYPMDAATRIKEILNQFSDTTARVYIVPDFLTFDLMQSRLRYVGNIVALSVHDTPFYGMSLAVKRIQDVVLSSIIIALISPVLLAVSIGVKLSSPGPIIFKQKRYGLDGKQISVWKFRSMRAMDNGPVVKQATKNDPRITRFGAFIRRTSLDELPQFFNVLTGRMSIVGPRPHAVAHNEEYRGLIDKYMLRHHVKPGITGWAQINGYRGETDTLDKMEKRIEYDLTYIQTWSLWLDIKIVFLTVFKGFVGSKAY